MEQYALSRSELYCPIKDNVRIQEHGMITSTIKKQTSVCCYISLNPYYGISNWESWNRGKKKKKRKAILLLAYIADVSCLTNRPFYMRTLSLSSASVLLIYGL